MNKRIKKKLLKRNNFYHYKKYCKHKDIEDFCINKYGKEQYENWKSKAHEYNNNYTTNLQLVTYHKRLGGGIKDVQLFSGVYPSSIS